MLDRDIDRTIEEHLFIKKSQTQPELIYKIDLGDLKRE